MPRAGDSADIRRTSAPTTKNGDEWEVTISGHPTREWWRFFQKPSETATLADSSRVGFNGFAMTFRSPEDRVRHWIEMIDQWIAAANESCRQVRSEKSQRQQDSDQATGARQDRIRELAMALRIVVLLALVLSLAACTIAPAPTNGSAPAAGSPSLDAVVKRTFTAYGFRLESGKVLPEMTLAYETYGRLAPDGRNAILLTHGFTSSQHMAGKYSPSDRAAGSWNGLVGPGKAIDTDRHFVVSSNMLGSSYGSTAPASVNPATGNRYGPDFPDITVRDIVAAQRLLLSALGVNHLVAVAGPSYGGFQAFQWAVSYPEFMRGIVAVVTAPAFRRDAEPPEAMIAGFAVDPNWNNGWHYDRGGIPTTLAAIRYDTLLRYGANEVLAVTLPDKTEREARLRQMSAGWAREFDPNSMVALRKALRTFDTTADFSKIRAKVLYVLSRTDKLFPPSIAPGVMDGLARAGVDARYFEIDSEFGHSASGPEWAKWGPTLKAFVDALDR